MKLPELLRGVCYSTETNSLSREAASGEVFDFRNMEISGVTCDSREVKRGFVFVANRGKLLNGEDFIDSAVANGAVCIVMERRVYNAENLAENRIPKKVETDECALGGSCADETGECGNDCPRAETSAIIPVYIYVSNTREALSIMSANFNGNPDRKLKMVGITGSNGKTTTAFMVDSILAAAGVPSGLLGTVFARTGKSNDASILTTPDSEKLQRYLREMVESGFKACIMEVSSIGIAMRRAFGIHYDVFAFNNISREHIDDHGDFDTYYALKSSVVESLDEDAISILSADDELTKRLSAKTKASVRLFSDSDNSAFTHIESLDLSTGRGEFFMRLGSERIHINLSVSGYHNVINSLSAATIAYSLGLGITPEHIKSGLEAYRGVERRFECIFDRDFVIFDDHFANPGNIDVTFETIHQMKYKNFRICYAVRGSRGTTVNRENVEAMLPHLRRLGVNKIVATASVETVTGKDEVTPAEKAVFLEKTESAGIAVEWHDRLTEAVRSSIDEMERGDVLLLAGCQGMDSGGHIALDYLSAKRRDKSIWQRISGRVCGFLPESFVEEC